MSKKKIKRIIVETLPNGYGLKFDGMNQPNGYMYFTPEDLLKGFMLHIGLNMTDQLSMENIDDFILSAMNWSDNAKCVKEIERLTMKVKMVNGRRVSLARQLVQERNRVLKLSAEISALRDKYATLTDICKDLRTIIKPYDKLTPLSLQNLGITDDMIAPEETSDETENEE